MSSKNVTICDFCKAEFKGNFSFEKEIPSAFIKTLAVFKPSLKLRQMEYDKIEDGAFISFMKDFDLNVDCCDECFIEIFKEVIKFFEERDCNDRD